MIALILIACGNGDCAMGVATWTGPRLIAASVFVAGTIVFWLVLRFAFRLKRPWALTGCALIPAALIMYAVVSGLANARHKALLTSSNCHLKQIGLAIAQYSADYRDICPKDLYALSNQLGRLDDVLIDPATCKPMIYVGAGVKWQSDPDIILAFAPSDGRGRNVLFNDGHVSFVMEKEFGDLVQHGAIHSGAFF